MKSTRKKVIDISQENVVFVRYSEIEDLRQQLNNVSHATSNLATSLSNIVLMSLRTAKDGKLLPRSTDTKGIKPHEVAFYKNSDLGAFAKRTDKRLKNTDSRSNGYRPGMIERSRRR